MPKKRTPKRKTAMKNMRRRGGVTYGKAKKNTAYKRGGKSMGFTGKSKRKIGRSVRKSRRNRPNRGMGG